jgi:hypothetical protein
MDICAPSTRKPPSVGPTAIATPGRSTCTLIGRSPALHPTLLDRLGITLQANKPGAARSKTPTLMRRPFQGACVLCAIKPPPASVVLPQRLSEAGQLERRRGLRHSVAERRFVGAFCNAVDERLKDAMHRTLPPDLEDRCARLYATYVPESGEERSPFVKGRNLNSRPPAVCCVMHLPP